MGLQDLMASKRLLLLVVLLFRPSSSFSGHHPKEQFGQAGDDFMNSLSARIEQANKLPLVFRETLLPNQVLNITIKPGPILDLVRNRLQHETPYFGMLGIQQTGDLMPRGVQVEILSFQMNPWKTGIRLQLRAERRFEIDDYVDENREGGWLEAKIRYLDNDTENETKESLDQARKRAEELATLSEQWIELARSHERFPNQMELLLNDIGEIPSTPSDVAFWVGALINPTPKIHLAFEVRQKLLKAGSANERTQIALDAITSSIQRMNGESIISRGVTATATNQSIESSGTD